MSICQPAERTSQGEVPALHLSTVLGLWAWPLKELRVRKERWVVSVNAKYQPSGEEFRENQKDLNNMKKVR